MKKTHALKMGRKKGREKKTTIIDIGDGYFFSNGNMTANSNE